MNILGRIISRILNWILDHLPRARTRYQAIVDGEIIRGCYECRHNIGEVEKPYFPPIHRCDADVDLAGKHPLIFDPLNIPDSCVFRVMEVEARK
jgi:hypothetical protein